MVKFNKYLRRTSYLMIIAILNVSCNVYTYTPTTIEDVEKSRFEHPVKVKMKSNQSFKFLLLDRVDKQLYGLAKAESRTARKMSDNIIEKYTSNNVKILLNVEEIQQVFIRDKNATLSVILPVLGGAILILGVMFNSAMNDLFSE